MLVFSDNLKLSQRAVFETEHLKAKTMKIERTLKQPWPTCMVNNLQDSWRTSKYLPIYTFVPDLLHRVNSFQV